jgi:hypothetical protein
VNDRNLEELDGDAAWSRQFWQKRDVIRRLAQQALEEEDRGETLPLADILRLPRTPRR